MAHKLVHFLIGDRSVYSKTDVDLVISDMKAENERLSNALDKERSETIKYMDELNNAKNEIERLTIDKRNAELRADVADATIEKLKSERDGALGLTTAGITLEDLTAIAKKYLNETKRALWIARAERAKERQNYESGCRSDGWVRRENMWLEVERLCRHKAEEYK